MDIELLVRKNILQLEPYSSARDEFANTNANLIFLDANENPFNSRINRYPDPYQNELKTVLSKVNKVPVSQILLGNGSDEVLDLLFRAFCEPKIDNILTLPPTYGMYKVLANINEVENREVLLNSNFQPDINAIINNSDSNSKILFLCSPNNPTANLFSIKKINTLLEKFKGLVVIDEAYIDFSSSNSWLEHLPKHSNLVITQTFSKAYGMAGIRLGVCYASPKIIAILNKIKPPYNINTLTQDAALKFLKENIVFKEHIYLINKEKEVLSKALVDIHFVEKIYPSDANFILVKGDDATNRYHQPLCHNTLRFTIGTSMQTKQLIKALKQLK